MSTNDEAMDPSPHAWLDKHVAAQAAYYGTTPAKMAAVMNDLATAQEAVESGQLLGLD